MSSEAFYNHKMHHSSSSSKKPSTPGVTTTATQKTWSSQHHCAEISSKFWSFKTTEIRMESGGSDNVLEANSAGSVISAPMSNNSSLPLSSSLGSSNSSTATIEDREASNREVKLPKNAVELIAWAITECNTTTPTLTHIASYIQAHVPTYREEDLSVLIKMVQHHLNKNNPTYFLPVLSPAGYRSHNPNLARWAINLQVVSVGEDGSLIRRRHRSHAHQSNSRRAHTPSSPFAVPTSHTTLMLSPPDGAGSGSGHNPQFASFSGYFSSPGPTMPPPSSSTLPGQPSPVFTGGSLPFPLFNSPSPAGSMTAGPQPASLGPAGLYGVPVSAPAAGSMGHPLSPPPAPSATGVTYQLPLC